ncbi:MAG: cell division protein FtsK, partial [Micrococcales bacterium]
MLAAPFVGLGRLTGGSVRRMGAADEPEIDPSLRRDGLGFLLLILAIVVASREWWGASGTFGAVVHAVVAGTTGRVGLVLPLVLLVLAWRLLRYPGRGPANGR